MTLCSLLSARGKSFVSFTVSDRILFVLLKASTRSVMFQVNDACILGTFSFPKRISQPSGFIQKQTVRIFDNRGGKGKGKYGQLVGRQMEPVKLD